MKRVSLPPVNKSNSIVAFDEPEVASEGGSSVKESSLALVPSFQPGDGGGCGVVEEYRRTALGLAPTSRSSLSPFSHPALLHDDSWDFMFQFGGRKVGRAVNATPSYQLNTSAATAASSGSGGTELFSSFPRHSRVGSSCFEGGEEDLTSMDATTTLDASATYGHRMSRSRSFISFRQPGRRKTLNQSRDRLGIKPYMAMTKRPMDQLPSLLEQQQRRVEAEMALKREQEAIKHSLKNGMEIAKDLPHPPPPRHQRNKPVYYTNLWRWAIGQTLLRCEKDRKGQLEVATRKFAELRRIKDAKATAALNAKRCQVATHFFGDVLKRLRSGKARSARLTEHKFFQLKETFSTICGPGKEELSIHEIKDLLKDSNLSADPSLFKKLDRDHSGYLEFMEMLRILYPIYTVREFKLLVAGWEKVKVGKPTEQQVREESTMLLSAESKESIAAIFRLCDKGRKGVLTRSDLDLIAPVEWDSSQYFTTPTSVLTIEDFTEIVKYGFPPYSGQVFTMEALKEVERKNPLPQLLLDMQERSTSSL